MSADADEARAATRRQRLGVAAALTLAATVWAAMMADDEVAPMAARPRADAPPKPAQRNDPRNAAAPVAPAVWPSPPRNTARMAWPAAAAQGLAAWSPPAPPPPPPAPPPAAPVAPAPPPPPPFPYTLIGRLDDGTPRALLAGPVSSFGVKTADVIDGQWRVDAIQERSITLTWLPGGVPQTLALPSS